jgi:hypothetical protein
MDKIMRLHAVSSTMENGFVYLPDKAEWLPELTAFPKGKHDDQVDSTSQALDWIRRDIGGREWEFSTSIAWNTKNLSKLARYRHVRSLIVKMSRDAPTWGTCACSASLLGRLQIQRAGGRRRGSPELSGATEST